MPPLPKGLPDEYDPLSRESLHTLKILDEVSKGKKLTQRDLSKKLGIALGMTNNYLKRLAHQGYIQIIQAERKRLHYLLTPKGITEKSALTYRYVKRSYQFFTDVRSRTRQFFSGLEGDGVASLVIYKPTVIAEIAVLVLQETSIHLAGVLDEEPGLENFLGYPVISPDKLPEIKFDRILITTNESISDVKEKFSSFGVNEKHLCLMI